jgi:O-antigen/teichoic acid export membrane protein
MPALRAFGATWRQLRHSTLLMNSLYLMLATGAVAAFGFLFWMVVARSYAAATVGLATTLLSVSGLISLVSLVGFDATFVRFLPRSQRKNDQINSGLIIVTLTSTVLALISVLVLPLTAPRLAFILHNPWYFLSFIFFTIMTSLNTLTNAIFLAFRQVKYIFIINVAFSALKVALPLLIVHGNTMTIFTMAGVAQAVGFGLSLVYMKRKLSYTFLPKVHWDILRVIKKYSFSVFASSIINLLPATLLPLLVIKQLGPENAAYFYMTFTIANLLYVIAYSSMQSAFAEGSHDESAIKSHIFKAAKLIAVLLLPAALVTALLSNFILGIFGDGYAAKGHLLLQLFTISSLFVAVYAGMGAIFKVTKNLRGVITMNCVYTLTILGFSYIFITRIGLVAIGWAWMLGNLTASIVALLFMRPTKSLSRRN